MLIRASAHPNISFFLVSFTSQMSPASGLVSILKKRHANMSVSASSEPRHEKPPAKRRVRFKFPDDGYEQGGFVCLLPTVQKLVSRICP